MPIFSQSETDDMLCCLERAIFRQNAFWFLDKTSNSPEKDDNK